MTAEGDNSVLMQKVAKEHLGFLSKNPINLQKPANTDLKESQYLMYLLRAREDRLFTQLGKLTYVKIV